MLGVLLSVLGMALIGLAIPLFYDSANISDDSEFKN